MYRDHRVSVSVSEWLGACQWAAVHTAHTCSCLGCSYDQPPCSQHVATPCHTQQCRSDIKLPQLQRQPVLLF